MRLRFYDHPTRVNRMTTIINFVGDIRAPLDNTDCPVSMVTLSTSRKSISSCHDQITHFETKIWQFFGYPPSSNWGIWKYYTVSYTENWNGTERRQQSKEKNKWKRKLKEIAWYIFLPSNPMLQKNIHNSYIISSTMWGLTPAVISRNPSCKGIKFYKTRKSSKFNEVTKISQLLDWHWGCC